MIQGVRRRVQRIPQLIQLIRGVAAEVDVPVAPTGGFGLEPVVVALPHDASLLQDWLAGKGKLPGSASAGSRVYPVVLLKQSQAGTDDFTGGAVATALNLAVDGAGNWRANHKMARLPGTQSPTKPAPPPFGARLTIQLPPSSFFTDRRS
jgi:hypothetical protein